MANKSDIETDITLELDGEQTAAKFLKAVSSFLRFVEEVTKTSAGGQARPDWTVKVKGGSNLIGLQPTPGFNPVVVQNTLNMLQKGIAVISSDTAIRTIPDEFSEDALRHLRKIAEITDDETTARIWVKKSPVRITQKVAAHITEIMGADYQDYGAVEGRLQVVSERGSYRAEITDQLNKKPIKCLLNEELMKQALGIFGQMVEAYGKIKYRKDGVIVSISVEEFIPFPPPEKIPSFKDVKGIFKN